MFGINKKAGALGFVLELLTLKDIFVDNLMRDNVKSFYIVANKEEKMKKIVSAALSLIIAVNILFMAPVANAQIKKDYLYWAQDDSSKPWYSMSIARDRHSSCTFAKYGCWIMAYAKLLVMSGA